MEAVESQLKGQRAILGLFQDLQPLSTGSKAPSDIQAPENHSNPINARCVTLFDHHLSSVGIYIPAPSHPEPAPHD